MVAASPLDPVDVAPGAPGRRTVPRVGPLVTVGELAKGWRRSYRSTLRLLGRMRTRDIEDGIGDAAVWWVGWDRYGRKLVNVLRLRARHPALFARAYVSREEYETLVERVAQLTAEVANLRRRYRALAARGT